MCMRDRGALPDGPAYTDLHGFDPSGMPAELVEALRGFLSAVAVPPQSIPPGLDALAGLYRSLQAERKMIVVRDSARTPSSAPAAAGSPGYLVIVTSRSQLTGLVVTRRHNASTANDPYPSPAPPWQRQSWHASRSAHQGGRLRPHRPGQHEGKQSVPAIHSILRIYRCDRLPICDRMYVKHRHAEPVHEERRPEHERRRRSDRDRRHCQRRRGDPRPRLPGPFRR